MPESSDRTTECGTGSESTFRTAVAAEVERLTSPAARRSKSDRFLAAGVLLLFGLGLAMARWPMFTFWDALLTPLVALLLQEVGSFTAMRLLGYRELPGGALIGKFKRIPRRDAAAGGRHFDEPGWKVASVALAGQLPGVALGIGGLVWVLSGEHEVPKWIPGASLLMLVFAGLQLLPFRPAGWRVVRVVLASRWPLFSFLFVGVFMGLSVPLLGWLLLGPWRWSGGFWLFACCVVIQAEYLFSYYRFGLTYRLLRMGYRPRAGADDRISRADVDFLVAQIQEFEPKFDQPRVVAKAAVEQYELLNHKPPGLALSAVFLLAQLGIILLGAVGASALELKNFARDVELASTACYSSDGTRIATTSWDGTARVWDARSGEELATLEGHEMRVWGVAFSPDGTRIAAASSDNTARVWDAATGEELAVLEGHRERVFRVAFGPDGRRIVTASDDATARMWDAATGEQLVVLEEHGDSNLSDVAFSPDGTRIATASSDNTARVWDADTGEELAVLEGHGDGVRDVAFSPDGTRIATASSDNTARVWDADTGASLAELKGHTHEVQSAAFSPDGRRIVTASWDGTARVWDASTGEQLAELKGHGDSNLSDVAFSPDGPRVTVVNSRFAVRTYTADGRLVSKIRLRRSMGWWLDGLTRLTWTG